MLNEITTPTHFRHLRTTTDLSVLDTVTLDNIACQLIREIDNLETFGRDHNGNWWGKVDYRSHAKWSKYLAAIEAILETRTDITV